MADFITPAFLQGHSTDEIYAAMRAMLPADIDSSEGSHAWNLMRPSAMVAAELYESTLPQVIMTIFPEFAAGGFLDAHAAARGLTRKAATASAGAITVTGSEGLVVPAGARFATAGTSTQPALEYITGAAATIPSAGSVNIDVTCAEAGTVGNTGAGTIVLVADGRPGVTGVTNASATTGGTEQEDDDSLRDRLLAYDQDRGTSYVGSVSDYKRWAMSVPGVGAVTVQTDDPDHPGQVTLLIVDENGDPVDTSVTGNLCTQVYDKIMGGDDPMDRLAPVNALLVVSTPTTLDVYLSATVTVEEGGDLATIKAAFLAGVQDYLADAVAAGEVRLTRVGAVLSGIAGVADYASLQRSADGTNWTTDNLTLTGTQLPTTSADKITLMEA